MSRLVKNIGLYIGAFLIGFAKMSCSPITDEDPVETDSIASSDGTKSVSHAADSAPLIVDDKLSAAPYTPGATIETKNVNPHDLVRFAHTLIGTPYKYASTDPKAGFDCSGFITYGFNPSKQLVRAVGDKFEKIPAFTRTENYSSFGAFINAKIGYKYAYFLPALSIYHQNYGTYNLFGLQQESYKGLTIIPSLGLQLNLGHLKSKE